MWFVDATATNDRNVDAYVSLSANAISGCGIRWLLLIGKNVRYYIIPGNGLVNATPVMSCLASLRRQFVKIKGWILQFALYVIQYSVL